MASLRHIKTRIRSIQNTKKVTSAMEMVSGAKLRKIEAPLHSFRPYINSLGSVLKNLLREKGLPPHPLMEKRAPVKTPALCVVTSDTGLCGTYNQNVINMCEGFLKTYEKGSVRLVTIGKKGFNYFNKRRYPVAFNYTGITVRYSDGAAEEIAEKLMGSFLKNEFDEIHAGYTRFMSAFKYKPVIEKLLNVEPEAGDETGYILEPDARRILEKILPRFVRFKVRQMLLEAATSEHSSRMLAMRAASDNASELVDALTLERNKARQASITKEIIEITSAAESLKG